MRLERDNDKIINPEIAVVCFDLENVINLPKTSVGSAFYKRKLNMYNMTAHVNLSKQVYCAVWNEAILGRSGNDLASAVIHCLSKIIEDNLFVKEIVTWSDSCVPQNRNYIISTAMINFLLNNPRIKSVTMKYSVPGHSCIQEVDNAHSQIEKTIKHLDIMYPIGLVRALLNVNRKMLFKILQLNINHFKNYHKMSKHFKFNLIPFNSVAQLYFSQSNLSEVKYKLSHGLNDFEKIQVYIKNNNINILQNTIAATIPNQHKITIEKVKDIESLYHFMSNDDKIFYTNLFKNYAES